MVGIPRVCTRCVPWWVYPGCNSGVYPGGVPRVCNSGVYPGGIPRDQKWSSNLPTFSTFPDSVTFSKRSIFTVFSKSLASLVSFDHI